MTHTKPTDRLDAAIRDYVEAVFREVMRVAARVRRGDPGDLADEISAEVLEQPEPIMARYPDPVRYARERVRHAGISLDRRERVQRGEGARLFVDDDGQLRPGRSVVAGDAAVREGGPTAFALLADPRSRFDDAAVDQLMATVLLRQCLGAASRQQLTELLLVDALGYEVTEVAELFGQCRETVSRRLSATRRLVRSQAMQAEQAEQATAAEQAAAYERAGR